MKNKSAAKKKAAMPATQQHLSLGEIKNDTILMKDGTLRAALMVSSINFALKNEDEQNAIVSSYIGFLNSLDHSIQIVIQSRELLYQTLFGETSSARKSAGQRTTAHANCRLPRLYFRIGGVKPNYEQAFFVIVPYDPLSNKQKGFWSRLMEVINPANLIKLKGERFLKRKYDLDQRVRQVESGLKSMGLEVARLDTQSLIELLYSTYNPDIALTEHLPPLNKIQVES